MQGLRKAFITGLIILLSLILFRPVASAEAIRHTRLGKAYFESGNYEAALEEFQKAAEIAPEDVDILYNLGGTFERLGRYEEALSQFAFILEIEPDDREATRRFNMNMRHMLEELKKHANQHPDDANLWMQIALISRELSLHDDTIAASRRAIAINPNIPYVHHSLATALHAQGKIPEAFEAIKKAFALKAYDDDIFASLEEISSDMERYESSHEANERSVDAALTGAPAEPGGVSAQVRKLTEAGKWEEAESLLQNVLTRDPDNESIMAEIERLQGFITTDSNAARHFERGLGYLEENRFRMAEEQLIRAEQTKPNRLGFRELNLAFVTALNGLGKSDEALTRLENVIEQNPTDLEIRIIQARTLEQLGRHSEALAEYEKILSFSDEIKASNASAVAQANSALSAHQRKRNIRFYGSIALIIVLLLGSLYGVYRLPTVQHKILSSRAQKAISSGNWVKSAETLGDLLQVSGLSTREKHWACLNHATALSHTGKHAQAVQQARKALSLNPNHRESHLVYARAALKNRLVSKEALYEYKLLLEAEPDNSELLLHLASIFADPARKGITAFQKDLFPAEGEALLLKALRLKPSDPAILRALGERFIKAEKLDSAAVSIYEKLLRLDYDNMPLHRLLARAYDSNGNYEGVIREIKYIFQTDTNDPALHDLFVKAHEKTNALPALLMEYESMIQAEPDDMMLSERISTLRKQYAPSRDIASSQAVTAGAATGLEELWDQANALLKAGNANQAITCLKTLINADYNTREVSFLLIKAFLSRGLHDLAWEQYCSLDLEDSMIHPKEKSELYELARILEDNDRLREAWEIFDLICRVDISFEDAFERFEQLDEYVRKS